MNIEDFKETVTEKKEEVELTDEQRQKVREFYVKKGAKDFKTYIDDIKKYIAYKNITIFQAIDEVKNKTSGLSNSRRQILLAISPDIWQEWLPTKEHLKQINYENNRI